MREVAVVTGVAGFIGSNLAETLVKKYHVIGIDCFTPYYSKQVKMQNIAGLRSNGNFELIEADLIQYDGLGNLKADLIFHLAAEPGVRASWGSNFETYVRNNISATQRILEACIRRSPRRFIFSSSSSVYGDAAISPVTENQIPRPVSPYGVTKLAAENLCYLYHKNYGLPTIALRYFTVYGPRLRPDLAISRFARAMLKGDKIPIYGDGSHSRDFTYISDVVEANLLAAKSEIVGEVFNIGSGKSVTIRQLIETLEEITGENPRIEYLPPQKGDVYRTLASIQKAKDKLGFAPKIEFDEGIRSYVNWLKTISP